MHSMRAFAPRRRSPLGKVPVVPWVRCAHCDKVLCQRHEPWWGQPLWIQCRGCRLMNRVDERGATLVDQQGD